MFISNLRNNIYLRIMLIIITEFNYYIPLMRKILEKFVENVKKLENYYLLKESNDYLLVGTEINIKKHHEVLNNVFQPYTSNKDMDFAVFFAIPFKTEFSELEEFRKRKIPMLILSKKILYSQDKRFTIEELLDDFVELKIKN